MALSISTQGAEVHIDDLKKDSKNKSLGEIIIDDILTKEEQYVVMNKAVVLTRILKGGKFTGTYIMPCDEYEQGLIAELSVDDLEENSKNKSLGKIIIDDFKPEAQRAIMEAKIAVLVKILKGEKYLKNGITG